MTRIERLHIGIFGRVNAGKSTLMNVLTQQSTSLEDPTPGTTADAKTALMQIHGLGAVKLFDTAGIDEQQQLGAKKKEKTLSLLQQVDIALLVIDPEQLVSVEPMNPEQLIVQSCKKRGVSVMLVCNVRRQAQQRLQAKLMTLQGVTDRCETLINGLERSRMVIIDLKHPTALHTITQALKKMPLANTVRRELLPCGNSGQAVLLAVVLDEQAPASRLLRPQQMALEYLLRQGINVGISPINIKAARSDSPEVQRRVRDEFMTILEAMGYGQTKGVQLVLVDSQLIDLMDQWLDRSVPLTTFSVMMIHQSAGAKWRTFAKGAQILGELCKGDKVLIAEACNHDRMTEDIGTVQLPNRLHRRIPGITIEHALGREFPPSCELAKYKLVIHCGGCMISNQQIAARVESLMETGVAVTNYGMALSWLQSPEMLQRVLAPWKSYG